MDKDDNLKDWDGLIRFCNGGEDRRGIHKKEDWIHARKRRLAPRSRWCCGGNVFILCQPPLEYDMGGEKVVLNELEELNLIDRWGLEFVWMRCGHGEADENLSEEWIARTEEEGNGSGWSQF
jgi:hypothetical protein